jgi:hypothetical protein
MVAIGVFLQAGWHELLIFRKDISGNIFLKKHIRQATKPARSSQTEDGE